VFPHVFYQVVACRLDNNDSLRLSTKDIEHGLHGGGHVCDETKGWSSFNMCVLLYKLLHMFIPLAHPICVCLAMIVYAVHGSR